MPRECEDAERERCGGVGVSAVLFKLLLKRDSPLSRSFNGDRLRPNQSSLPRARATMWSAVRKLAARMVSVGAAPPEVGMKLPSTTKRLGTE